MIVVLEEQIYVYDISNMKLLHTIETSPNPNGMFQFPALFLLAPSVNLPVRCYIAICALSPSSDRCYIAYPRPTSSNPSPFSPPSHAPPSAGQPAPLTGDVLLFDALKLEAVNVVEAHKSPLSHVALNNDGTLLATASDKGTIIRVFSVPGAQKLYQFRRGTYPSRIFSMSFNLMSSLLCISSATETVHIFRLGGSPPPSDAHSSSSHSVDSAAGSSSYSPTSSISSLPSGHAGPAAAGFEQYEEKARHHNGSGSFGSMIRRSSQTIGRTLAGAAGGYLPNSVTEMWKPARDFAFVKLKKPGVKSVVALSSSSPQVMVVTSDGDYYIYNVDMESGGECVLTKQYSCVDPAPCSSGGGGR